MEQLRASFLGPGIKITDSAFPIIVSHCSVRGRQKVNLKNKLFGKRVLMAWVIAAPVAAIVVLVALQVWLLPMAGIHV